MFGADDDVIIGEDDGGFVVDRDLCGKRFDDMEPIEAESRGAPFETASCDGEENVGA